MPMVMILSLAVLIVMLNFYKEWWRWIWFVLSILLGIAIPFLAPLAFYFVWLAIRPSKKSPERIAELEKEIEMDGRKRRKLDDKFLT